MLKDEILDIAHEKMYEDGITDDDMPDKEMDYIVSVASDLSDERIMEWALSEGAEYLKKRLSKLKTESIEDWLVDSLIDHVMG